LSSLRINTLAISSNRLGVSGVVLARHGMPYIFVSIARSISRADAK